MTSWVVLVSGIGAALSVYSSRDCRPSVSNLNNSHKSSNLHRVFVLSPCLCSLLLTSLSWISVCMGGEGEGGGEGMGYCLCHDELKKSPHGQV